jgi:integrase
VIAPLAEREAEPFELEHSLDHVRARARDYVRAARAENTRIAYAGQWARFVAWADLHTLASLPAAPDTVALYLVHLADLGRRPSTIDLVLAAIGKAHRIAGHPSPRDHVVVTELRAGIRRRLGTAPRRVDPLLADDLRTLTRGGGDGIRDVRDRALLLLGWAGALRRSELVAIDLADLRPVARGLVLTLRISKTDQEGAGVELPILRGRPGSCPVAAVEAWIARAGLTSGALFRGTRGRTVTAHRLTAGDVARILQRRAPAIGLDPALLAGHSLRAGFITSAALAGRAEWAIQQQTRHRSAEVLRGYIRRATLFEAHAGEGLL